MNEQTDRASRRDRIPDGPQTGGKRNQVAAGFVSKISGSWKRRQKMNGRVYEF
jgi:hypothetical protein